MLVLSLNEAFGNLEKDKRESCFLGCSLITYF